MVTTALSIQTHRDRAGFDHIRDDWLALMADVSRQSFNHHPVWFDAYFNCDPDQPVELEFRCVYRDQILVALFPLTRHRGRLVTRARLPVNQWIYTTDCVVSDRENKQELWRFVCRESARTGDGWDLFTVGADGSLATSHIFACMPQPGPLVSLRPRVERCTVIDVIDYDVAIQGLKKKFRSNLNRGKRRLNEKGGMEFRRVTDPAGLDQAFTEFVELELDGWKGQEGEPKEGYPTPSAIGLYDWKERFYRNVVNGFGKLGATEICLLSIDGRTIGAQITVVLNQVSYLLKTTYDESVEGASPGQLLIDYLFQQYAREGNVREINLITDYPYFRHWNPRHLTYYRLQQFSRSPRGLLARVRTGLGR
jgi:CelD/BcsL family acetyltransferase involved in cellulose biosynthesis